MIATWEDSLEEVFFGLRFNETSNRKKSAIP